jgi:hypothetical protein
MIKEIKTICEEEDENSKDMPLFLFAGDYISITGKALPEFAPKSWYPFLEKLREHVLTVNKIQVDFKLDFYNSSSSRYITDMLDILSENRLKCTPLIHWYYFKEDDDTFADGEMWQEAFKKIKIVLIPRN